MTDTPTTLPASIKKVWLKFVEADKPSQAEVWSGRVVHPFIPRSVRVKLYVLLTLVPIVLFVGIYAWLLS